MRSILPALAFAASLSLAAGAVAQQGQHNPLPGQTAPANCTDVQVGSAQSYDCINAQLGALAHAAPRPSSDVNAPISPNSPSNTLGIYNEEATRERLGPNFGHSVQSWHPPVASPPALPR